MVKNGGIVVNMKAMQFRMARSALNLSIDRVAEASGLHRTTIHRIEQEDPGERRLNKASIQRLAAFYESQGIVFLEGDVPGVAYRAP